MNGSSEQRSSSKIAFEDLRLSIDPTTISLALGEKPVKSIEGDGTLVYDEHKMPDAKLTEQLERIWNEYPSGLLEVTEQKLERLPPNENAKKPQEEGVDEAKKRDPFSMMTYEEMEKLRSEIFLQLNDARNELWFVLELAKTLSLSSSFTTQPPPPPTALHQKKSKAKPAPAALTTLPSIPGEPPILPPGTFSTTLSEFPAKPLHAQIYELEQLLLAKQIALNKCQGLIDGAVGELRLMAHAGDRFWKDIRNLKEGEGGRGKWAVVPKPDFGRVGGKGEKAKDVIIPYAIDEAPSGTRARCLAGFDLDPTKKNGLTFGDRHHLRLRATLRDDSGSIISSTPAEVEDQSDVRAMMDAAQMEAFDEDLFNEIRFVAARIPKSEIEPQCVSFPVADQVLSFELYNTRSPPSSSTSPICDIIISSIRLSLLNIHRQRKINLVTPSQNLTSPVPSILQPIIDTLRFRQLCNVVSWSLNEFNKTLRNARLDSRIKKELLKDGQDDVNEMREVLLGKRGVEVLTGKYSLGIDDSYAIIVGVSAPYSTIVHLSSISFPLANPDELSQVVSDDLSIQLLRLAARHLHGKLGDEHKEGLYCDTLEEVVRIGEIALLRLSIPAPFHAICGSVESERISVPAYDSRQSGVGVFAWLDTVSQSIENSLSSSGSATRIS
ncbi:hypothetical protein I312_103116 [Cryptococcus bacillisporus CA1280]|uniref:Mediator of RNA polymerase II transcription subunit 17 n=1 Tax=Cryptococcus bacillisporus CA1280 TaxID=1296109 RepID=A0A0D0TLT9_CRYGA|nr:hypothetical protein I312_03329 [Cryptococcus bacillisporus CA1280]